MWSRMFRLNTMVATVLTMLVTYPICWLLVFKAGWRYSFLLDTPADANDSFFGYWLISMTLIACLFSPLLALQNLADRTSKLPAPQTRSEP